MKIHYVEAGKRAPDNVDKVTIHNLPGGKAGYTGVVRTEGVQTHFVQANDFDTIEEAELMALTATEDCGAKFLYIEHPNG